MKSLNYRDTERKIEVEIYGLKFEIKEDIEEIDLKDINSEDEKVIEKTINRIIGDGAFEKINKRRLEDGYGKINLQVGMTIITFLINSYVDVLTAPVNNMANKMNRYKKNKKYGR